MLQKECVGSLFLFQGLSVETNWQSFGFVGKKMNREFCVFTAPWGKNNPNRWIEVILILDYFSCMNAGKLGLV